jgi:hypothetical protein
MPVADSSHEFMFRVLHNNVQLRLLVTLCAHPFIREIILQLSVPKPRAWTAAEQFRRKQHDANTAGSFPAAVQFYGQQRSAWDRQAEEASRPTVEPLQLAFLCLRLPMSLAVKSQLLALATVAAAAGPEYACAVSTSPLPSMLCFTHFLRGAHETILIAGPRLG